MKQIICYHGTNKKNANKILKEGFKKGTYFAKHLEDALGFGGKWIFEVRFFVPLPKNWQFIITFPYKKENIVRLKHYHQIEMIFENDKLNDEIFKSNLKDQFNSY